MALVIEAINRFAPKTPEPSKDGIVIYKQTKLIKITSIFLVLSWVGLLVIFTMVAMLVAEVDINNNTFTSILSIPLVFGALYASSMLFVKCNHCDKRVFVQWSNIPPYSTKYCGLSGFGAIALEVLLKQKFTCMHCGQQHTVDKNA